MKPVILPAILMLAGLSAGGAAALFMPSAEPECAPVEGHDVMAETPPEPELPREYARLNNQFVVPVLTQGHVASLVSVGLTLEVAQGTQANVFAVEPRLRDSFLQVMFDHANAGGFNGDFTEATPMRSLRGALLSAAQSVLGEEVSDVLILDITRQDL